MNTLKIHPIDNSSVKVEPSGPPHRQDSFDAELERLDRKNSVRNIERENETPKASINHDNKP